MNVTPLVIPQVLAFEPQLFSDERGSFFESFNADRFEAATRLKRHFVQDNHSLDVTQRRATRTALSDRPL